MTDQANAPKPSPEQRSDVCNYVLCTGERAHCVCQAGTLVKAASR